QCGDAADVCVGLSALGLRPAEHDLRPAVPEREGQAQHPRRDRGTPLTIAPAQRQAAAEPAAVRQPGDVTAVRRLFAWHAFAALLFTPFHALHAQDSVEAFYQNRPINLVVGY